MMTPGFITSSSLTFILTTTSDTHSAMDRPALTATYTDVGTTSRVIWQTITTIISPPAANLLFKDPNPGTIASALDDAMSLTLSTISTISKPLRYLRHVLQRVYNLLRRCRWQRHDLFMLIPSSLLMSPFPTAVKPPNWCCHILVLNDRCLFSNNDYDIPPTCASNQLHNMKMNPHRQWLVDGMPPNQLPQATFGFLPPCQLRCASPCYIFFLFSTMEHYFFCLLTTFYASSYALMLFPGSDEFFLIPIMYYVCISYGHFSYLHICNLSGLFLSFKDFLSSYKSLAYEINLIFC